MFAGNTTIGTTTRANPKGPGALIIAAIIAGVAFVGYKVLGKKAKAATTNGVTNGDAVPEGPFLDASCTKLKTLDQVKAWFEQTGGPVMKAKYDAVPGNLQMTYVTLDNIVKDSMTRVLPTCNKTPKLDFPDSLITGDGYQQLAGFIWCQIAKYAMLDNRVAEGSWSEVNARLAMCDSYPPDFAKT